jgi:ribosomal-protein-serine acetyltransferase
MNTEYTYLHEIVIDDEITLRMRGISDAVRTFELIDSGREYLREFMGLVDGVQSVEDCEKFILQQKGEFGKEGGLLSYGIFYHNQLVGIIGFVKHSTRNNYAEIGYWLGQGYQGKGIMTRSVEGLTKYSFEGIGLHRIEIQIAVQNISSTKIPQKLGFTLEGVRKGAECINGEYLDIQVFGAINPK